MTNASKAENFEYSSLGPSPVAFRLISLLPGSQSEEIHCRIMHASLDDQPRYEALSYYWGSPDLGYRTIILNNQPFRVYVNLWIALCHLRFDHVGRVLWIDALCIDQRDGNEKALQIERMRNIYQTASKVLVWLGEEGQDSDMAMDLVPRLKDIDLRNIPLYIEDPDMRKAWDALHRLCRRPWWTRSWVLQEVVVAQGDPLVGCGRSWLPWSKFLFAQKKSGLAASSRVLQTLPQTLPLFTIFGLKRRPHQTIGGLLQGAIPFQATCPHDHIYALLGLAAETDRCIIKPDYSKSMRQLYTEVAFHNLQRDINMLCFNINSWRHQLPSWVSDWTRTSEQWPLWVESTYSAARNLPSSVEFMRDGSILKVKGLLVDTIAHFDEKSRTEFSPTYVFKSTTDEVLDNTEAMLREVIRKDPLGKLAALNPMESGALWRTLVANRSLTGGARKAAPNTPAPLEFENMYQVLRKRSQVPGHVDPRLPDDRRKEEYVEPFLQAFRAGNHRVFVTRAGRIGLGPHKLLKGDHIVLLYGADMPFVLRPINGHFRLIGPAYVHGIMKGEAIICTEGKILQNTTYFHVR
jgi:Heterokaryon incompatibility protein (HET)